MNTLVRKVDLFMQCHILPEFRPQNIHWVFSISGGKDSYALCESVRQWYEEHNFPLNASGIYIWQWGDDNPTEFLRSTFSWLQDFQVIDARSCTAILQEKGANQQAPCRRCADIRRHFSDRYLEKIADDKPVLLCRGLHMTDMTVSILWRLMWYGTGECLEGKGMPLVQLARNIYLAKPLCFAREFECQEYAKQKHYTPLKSDCPVNMYPSRRDIIEESLRMFYTSDLWEFDVPGSLHYLKNTAGITDIPLLMEISKPGYEIKENILPEGYFEFAKDYFLQADIPSELKNGTLLEDYVEPFLSDGTLGEITNARYSCKLFRDISSMSQFELRMVGTLGPFWAAMTLQPQQRARILDDQHRIWGLKPDVHWSQVCVLLKKYYER